MRCASACPSALPRVGTNFESPRTRALHPLFTVLTRVLFFYEHPATVRLCIRTPTQLQPPVSLPVFHSSVWSLQ